MTTTSATFDRDAATTNLDRDTTVFGLAQPNGPWHLHGPDRTNPNIALCGELLTGSKDRADVGFDLIGCAGCRSAAAADGILHYPFIATPPGLSASQRRLFDSARDFGRYSGHGILVSGHAYRSALSLERKGLGAVRYQGPTMGWYSVIPTPIQVPATAPALA